ncbi:MAG: protease modulator HflC [Gammaproteobacteria bacterium]|nr:MAG: protease modulator HflC [Gammaproteobacteria bacterium]RLA50839.1 MAG: protease modulator HflC [Gammaproteobacteria bacterium]
MSRNLSTLLIGIVLAIMLANSTLYVVQETEKAVKLRFGRIVEPDIAPGLYWKFPFADDVRKFDARILTLDSEPESFLTVQKKRLIVDAFAKWKIIDVETYYKATGGDETVARSRLADRVNDGLRNQFGTRTLHEAVSGERDELMLHIAEALNETVLQSLGVVVVDVRVKRIDLPPEVSQQVYRRMQAERDKEARELRSKGKESAERIRADADRQVTIVAANAYREAEQTRGEGDGKAAAIYAESYQKDPEFYSFSRSLKAYGKAFANKGDIVLVEPDSDFFRYLKSPTGKNQ